MRPASDADIGPDKSLTEDNLDAYYATTPRKEVKSEAKAIMKEQGVYMKAAHAKTWDVVTALYLGYLLSWSGCQRDPQGWIYKSDREMEEESGMTRSQQRRAREALEEVGIIQTRTGGYCNTRRLRVNIPRLKLLEQGTSGERISKAVEDPAPASTVVEDTQPREHNDQPVEHGERALARIAQTHTINTQGNTSRNHSTADGRAPVGETGRPPAILEPGGGGEVTSGKLAECLAVLQGAAGIRTDDLGFGESVAALIGSYPDLDPVLVCAKVRDFASRTHIRYPTRLLAKFFERAEEDRLSQPMNPHSPDGKRAKQKANHAEWYAAFFEVTSDEAQGLIDRGMAHEEILETLEGQITLGETHAS